MNGADLNPTESQPAAAADDTWAGAWGGDGTSEVVEARVVRRARPTERRRSSRLLRVQAALTVLFVAVLVGLLVVGRNLVLDLRGGATFSSVTDPAAPGYRAEVTPSPVLLALFADGRSGLSSAALLVQNLSGGGTVVPLATEMLVPPGTPGSDVAVGAPAAPEEAAEQVPLDEVFRTQGAEAVAQHVGQALGFGVSEFAIVSPDEASAVFGASGAIAFDNPTDLIGADDKVAYPAGRTTLAADDVLDYLGPVDPREIAPNRVLRSQIVWDALLAARATATDATTATPRAGQSPEIGFGAMVAGIAMGEHRTDSVPLERVPGGDATDRYWPSRPRLPEFVGRSVPFPQSATPGQRLRAIVLNGTSDPTLLSSVTTELVAHGMEIVRIGNADSLDVATSTVRYTEGDDRARDVATKYANDAAMTAEAHGGSGGVDLQIVLGGDRV